MLEVFKSGLMLIFWTFKSGFDVNILTFSSSSTVLATFFQTLGDFFQSSGHTDDRVAQQPLGN